MPSATPSESAERPLRLAVLADSDTRWKWGALTAQRLAPGAVIDGLLLRGRATPTARQLQDTGVRGAQVREVSADGFLAAAGVEGAYDVVVLSCVGGTVQAMLHGLAHRWQGHARRPVVVTGYVGVVYEKLADGLLLRHGADLVLANSAYDADRFRTVYAGVGADTDSVVECALPFLGGAPYAPSDERPYTVTFAVQPSVPETRKDRLYLLQRAAAHARFHPEREVLIKLRSKPGEHTTHVEELPYQRLADRLPGGLPANCRLVYGHMGQVLDRTDLLVTVSSTAALESLHRNIPTAILTDLGVREPLGNHHFVGSGCLTSWDRLDAGEVPRADREWTARQGVAADGPYEAAFDAARKRIAGLLYDDLPPLTPFYTATTAPGYLPGILARHGLAPDGSPSPSAAEGPGSGVGGAARRVVRRAARGAYRQGVQRVAPVIRRMGQL
ncbi:DUF6716 putative glycosyltransferase [Streptomyces sp. TRM 70351]|uniref:DUF6716 putative glycosyltransferase n=1 Tax=Streptomyces sp. TRM 70351 TaxID=3116552 RepID=UPI002E7C2C32|nr:DUF6716 putative glycosyltransferase [Streptomyces sp. TRM 70351]MEE1927921.1 DUF6716 putative glycosyltransferase [Streptomyces sp. TRM 70351]